MALCTVCAAGLGIRGCSFLGEGPACRRLFTMPAIIIRARLAPSRSLRGLAAVARRRWLPPRLISARLTLPIRVGLCRLGVGEVARLTGLPVAAGLLQAPPPCIRALAFSGRSPWEPSSPL